MNLFVIVVTALALTTSLYTSPAAAAERLGYCGIVKAYSPATAAADGSLTIGSRTFAIASGTQNQGTHEPTVGERRCALGETDAQDRFTVLSVEASLIDSACGEVVAYTPPTSASDGSLTLQVAARPPVTYVVPTTTHLPTESGSGQRCFALDVNAAGDAIITGMSPTPPEGRAAATAAPVRGLPSTATSDLPLGWLGLGLISVAVLVWTARPRRTGSR